MKYVVSLVLGFVVGALLFLAALYWNPFAGRSTVSPLAVSSTHQRELSYSLAVEDAVAFLNDGQSRIAPYPEKAQTLWEPTINDTVVRVAILDDTRGRPAGFGVKFTSGSEQSRLLNAEVRFDSIWHVWLAEQGGMMIEQTENHWPWLRDVVIPAWLSGGDSWRGSWFGILTDGPNALGTGVVREANSVKQDGEAVEAIRASAYSSDSGPVDATGKLTVALPAASSVNRP